MRTPLRRTPPFLLNASCLNQASFQSLSSPPLQVINCLHLLWPDYYDSPTFSSLKRSSICNAKSPNVKDIRGIRNPNPPSQLTSHRTPPLAANANPNIPHPAASVIQLYGPAKPSSKNCDDTAMVKSKALQLSFTRQISYRYRFSFASLTRMGVHRRKNPDAQPFLCYPSILDARQKLPPTTKAQITPCRGCQRAIRRGSATDTPTSFRFLRKNYVSVLPTANT